MGRGNRLPERWLDYSKMGQEIQGIRILACKVPIKEDMFRNKSLERELWFTPENFIALVPNVGCIIDLTATDKYYNPAVFTEKGIQYVKICCEGKKLPKQEIIQRFFRVADAFLRSSGNVLLVHCTHGLNRTGYLVSRYQRNQLQEQAVGHGQDVGRGRGGRRGRVRGHAN